MVLVALLISAFYLAFGGVEAVTIYTTLSSDNGLSLTPTPTLINPIVSAAISNLAGKPNCYHHNASVPHPHP
jgi:hypothetical protein